MFLKGEGFLFRGDFSANFFLLRNLPNCCNDFLGGHSRIDTRVFFIFFIGGVTATKDQGIHNKQKKIEIRTFLQLIS